MRVSARLRVGTLLGTPTNVASMPLQCAPRREDPKKQDGLNSSNRLSEAAKTRRSRATVRAARVIRHCCVALTLSCVLSNSARADRDPEFETGLAPANMQNANELLPGPTYVRSQLTDSPSRVPKIAGATLVLTGSIMLVGGWVMYVARQNFRLQVRYDVGREVLNDWEQQGAWALWLSAGGAAAIVASEYLLLPESQDTPTIAWLGGVAGLATAAAGLGFAAGGTHCAPVALRPAAAIPRGCLSGTSDTLFGEMLLLTAAPLLNLPLTYLLRSLFKGTPESLTLGPGSVAMTARF